jgi:hypothetical protein
LTERLATSQEGLSSIEKYSGLLFEIQKSELSEHTSAFVWIVEISLCNAGAETIGQ